MSDTLSNIDELIAYIESPEYLRMTAEAQGENAYPLLGSEAYAPVLTPDPRSVPRSPYYLPDPVPYNRPVERSYQLGPNGAAVQLTTRDPVFVFGQTLRDELPFKTHGKFYGVAVGDRQKGMLPEPHRSRFEGELPDITYVVYSYNTPIAWHVEIEESEHDFGADYWVVPDTRYSVTTSRHQNKIRTALDGLTVSVMQ